MRASPLIGLLSYVGVAVLIVVLLVRGARGTPDTRRFNVFFILGAVTVVFLFGWYFSTNPPAVFQPGGSLGVPR